MLHKAAFYSFSLIYYILDFPGGASGKESACQCRRCKRHGFNPWEGKIPWSRKWKPTPVYLPGKFHGQRSLVHYSPCSRKESDTTEQLRTLYPTVWIYDNLFAHSTLLALCSFQILTVRNNATMNRVVHFVFLVFVFLLVSHVQVFVNPWTAAHQAPLSSMISWS